MVVWDGFLLFSLLSPSLGLRVERSASAYFSNFNPSSNSLPGHQQAKNGLEVTKRGHQDPPSTPDQEEKGAQPSMTTTPSPYTYSITGRSVTPASPFYGSPSPSSYPSSTPVYHPSSLPYLASPSPYHAYPYRGSPQAPPYSPPTASPFSLVDSPLPSLQHSPRAAQFSVLGLPLDFHPAQPTPSSPTAQPHISPVHPTPFSFQPLAQSPQDTRPALASLPPIFNLQPSDIDVETNMIPDDFKPLFEQKQNPRAGKDLGEEVSRQEASQQLTSGQEKVQQEDKFPHLHVFGPAEPVQPAGPEQQVQKANQQIDPLDSLPSQPSVAVLPKSMIGARSQHRQQEQPLLQKPWIQAEQPPSQPAPQQQFPLQQQQQFQPENKQFRTDQHQFKLQEQQHFELKDQKRAQEQRKIQLQKQQSMQQQLKHPQPQEQQFQTLQSQQQLLQTQEKQRMQLQLQHPQPQEQQFQTFQEQLSVHQQHNQPKEQQLMHLQPQPQEQPLQTFQSQQQVLQPQEQQLQHLLPQQSLEPQLHQFEPQPSTDQTESLLSSITKAAVEREPRHQLKDLSQMKHMSRKAALASLMMIAGSDWDLSQSIEQNLLGGPEKSDYSCPAPEGHFPDQQKCDVYYQCSGGVANKHICPKGLKYSVLTNQCDWETSVDCSLNRDPGMLARHSGPSPSPARPSQPARLPFTALGPIPSPGQPVKQPFTAMGPSPGPGQPARQPFTGFSQLPFSGIFRL